MTSATYRIKYAELLNPAQLAAVTHRDGPLLVVAGAGSGKTRTLIYRVARLIESGVPPGAILLLTFTRRAAQEMLRRVEQLVGDRSTRGGRRYLSFVRQPGVAPASAPPIGLKPNFTILDRSDMEDVINLLRTRMGLGVARIGAFPRRARSPKRSAWRATSVASWSEELEIDFPHLVEHRRRLLAARRRPTTPTSASAALLDYDDLLYRLAELLRAARAACAGASPTPIATS